MAAKGVKRLKVHLPLCFMHSAVSLMGKLLKNSPTTNGELKSLEVGTITELDAVEKQFGFKPLSLSRGLGFLKEES